MEEKEDTTFQFKVMIGIKEWWRTERVRNDEEGQKLS